MKKKSKAKTIFFQLSAILILLAAALFYIQPSIAKYVMIVGVSGYGACVFSTPYPGISLHGKRLHSLQVFSVILMAVSAYLMYVDRMEWVILLLLAAILTLAGAILLPRIYAKEQSKEAPKK